jgi:RNA polymerase sigma-70 factor (ECF subfamily)
MDVGAPDLSQKIFRGIFVTSIVCRRVTSLTTATAYASVSWVSVPDPEVTRRLDALVREHQSALYAFAVKLCGDPSDARDLVQDTFERAVRADAQARGNDRAWLFTVLHHLFVDRYRRRRREPRLASLEDHDIASSEPTPVPLWAQVTLEQLQQALDELDPEFREVYRMHALEGVGYAEIAARLGTPVSTVGTRILRARRKLKAILSAQLPKGDA